MIGAYATILGGIAAVFFLIPPYRSFLIGTTSEVMALVGYTITCAIIVLIIHIAITGRRKPMWPWRPNGRCC